MMTFEKDAQTLVDVLFDTKLFRDDLQRKDLRHIEHFVMKRYKARFKDYVETEEFINKYQDKSTYIKTV